MITASVVTYNTEKACLERLLDCISQSTIDKVYIIDNSETDKLRELESYSEKVEYFHCGKNLGYGSGHNVAIRKSIALGADYHAVLNPDIYWTEPVIEELSMFMDHNPDCGLVMPKILYPNGEIQYLCKLLPTPMDLIGRRFIPIKSYNDRMNYIYELRWADYNEIMDVPSLSGCFMFMRVSVLKDNGGFDERYFMYGEDLDLCRRIGFVSRTVYDPRVSVYHEYEKGSYKSHKLLRYHMTSMIKYFNKWGWIFDSERKKRNAACKAHLNYKKGKA